LVNFDIINLAAAAEYREFPKLEWNKINTPMLHS